MGSITSFATTSMRRRAERAADTMRDQASSAADSAADAGNTAYGRFNDLLDDLQAMLGRAQKVSDREYVSLRKQMTKKLDSASDVLESLSGDAAVAARRTLKSTNKTIRANPLQTVGLVAVAGLVIGFLLARR